MILRILLFPVLLLLVGCDSKSDDPITADESLLIGTWKHTQSYISSGAPQYWVNQENGKVFEFFENGIFSSDMFAECSIGDFSIEEHQLLLKYNCPNFTSETENDNGFITYTLEFYSNYFILIPTSGPVCIEGCSFKYEKQN